MFNRKTTGIAGRIVPLSLLFFLCAPAVHAQQSKPVSLDAALKIALEHNLRIRSAQLNEQAGKALQRSAFDAPKTLLSGDYGQMNSVQNDTRFGVSQSISFPSVYTHQKKALRENYYSAQAQTQLSEQELKTDVRRLFYELVWMNEKKKLLHYADSIYRLFEKKSALRFKTGETNILEKTTAETRRQQISNQLAMLDSDIGITRKQFNIILQDSVAYTPLADSVRLPFSTAPYDTEKSGVKTAPQIRLLGHQAEAARWRWKTEKARLLPDLMLGYNNQSIAGSQLVNGQEVSFSTAKRFNYVSAGIGIPLFFGAQSARITAAKLEWQQSEARRDLARLQIAGEQQNTLSEIRKFALALDYYQNRGIRNAGQIITTADQQFSGGEIDYLQWVILVDQAVNIRNEYLYILNQYNQAVIRAQQLFNL